MGCSIHVIWIISIKEHCFFSYIIFFWPLFLFVNFLHSFHLTYKLSPASLPKKFTKLFDTLFDSMKLSKKEFKLLTQHSLIINLNKGENYLIENESPIDEKVSILLEGKLNVKFNNNIHLHQIYPNDFIDSPEFKYVECYLNSNLKNLNRQQSKQQQTYPLTTFFNSMNESGEEKRICLNCKQILIEIEEDDSLINKRPINLSSINKNAEQLSKKATKTKKIDKLHSKNHQKNCIFNKQLAENSCATFENSPIKDKHYSINKLAQVTITASENCKLLCWKRALLVNDTLANNSRLKTIFDNLIGKDIIHKLYLVNEEQRRQQQQIIGDSQTNDEDDDKNVLNFNSNKLLVAHNPLKGDLNKLKELSLLNAYPSPFIPHDSLMYGLGQYNRTMNQDLILKQHLISNFNPYLNYPIIANQAILNPSLILQSNNLTNDQQQSTNQ